MLLFLWYLNTQTSPFAISPQLFHSKLKTLLLAGHILIHRLPHTSLPVSTSSTIHHSRLLSACLTLYILTAAFRFCCGKASVNKLVPATSLLLAL